MKFKVSSSAFYSRLIAASKVLSSKNSMPILDCFLLDVKDGYVTITASDSEKYFITSVPTIEQSENASFCLPAKTIIDSIKELAEQPLTISYTPEDHKMEGTHNNGTFSVMAQDAAPYPTPKTVSEEGAVLRLPAEVLLNGITRCLFATANDEIRLVMNGIYFDVQPEQIVFASTDGRKLVRNINRTVKSGITAGFIIPKKVAAILRSVLTKDDEDVEIQFDADKACIRNSDITMHFRLIEGRYPNYNAVIPENNPYTATVDRQALASALKRVSVFCSKSSGLVKLELNNNALRLTGKDTDYATSAEEFLVCDYNNTPITIGFSCQFLIEITSILEDENVTIEVADPSRPGVIHPAEQNSDDEIIMLVMPMRVED